VAADVFHIVQHLVGLDPLVGQGVHDVIDVAHDYCTQAHDARLNRAVDDTSVMSTCSQETFSLN
jgi:hypothetical protein